MSKQQPTSLPMQRVSGESYLIIIDSNCGPMSAESESLHPWVSIFSLNKNPRRTSEEPGRLCGKKWFFQNRIEIIQVDSAGSLSGLVSPD